MSLFCDSLADRWQRKILCYVSPARNIKTSEWLDIELSSLCGSDARTYIAMMGKIRRWELPDYRARIHGYGGLGELRWTVEQKQYRPMGY